MTKQRHFHLHLYINLQFSEDLNSQFKWKECWTTSLPWVLSFNTQNKQAFDNNSALGNVFPGLIMKKFLSFCLRASARGLYFSLSTFLFILTFNKLPSHPPSGRRCQDPACCFHILEGLQLPVPTSVCGGPFWDVGEGRGAGVLTSPGSSPQQWLMGAAVETPQLPGVPSRGEELWCPACAYRCPRGIKFRLVCHGDLPEMHLLPAAFLLASRAACLSSCFLRSPSK